MIERELRGLATIIASTRRRGMIVIGDTTAETIDEGNEGGGDDGYLEAVQEIFGFDVNSLSPILSSLAQNVDKGASGGGGGGGSDKAIVEAVRLKEEREKLEREKAAGAKRTRTILWVVLGLVGTAIVGTGIYFVARRK